MPGMLDTVLNLGLNERSVEGLARQTGDEHLAWDSRRRLIQMFAEVVRGVPAMATWHPAYLLRNPAAKRDTWEDMKLVRDLLASDS